MGIDDGDRRRARSRFLQWELRGQTVYPRMARIERGSRATLLIDMRAEDVPKTS